ncbi:hypothetical protein QFC19_008206 [Naganishia cerealis]|uniref:Uncharacterized protein n=1 Tax=Naganishia cerealis TaxID=610337 RepID=A0ACC2V5B2_9TREE|nr:hypothetical protein QFC19_008206 [Naganishia cerealis]
MTRHIAEANWDNRKWTRTYVKADVEKWKKEVERINTALKELGWNSDENLTRKKNADSGLNSFNLVWQEAPPGFEEYCQEWHNDSLAHRNRCPKHRETRDPLNPWANKRFAGWEETIRRSQVGKKPQPEATFDSRSVDENSLHLGNIDSIFMIDGESGNAQERSPSVASTAPDVASVVNSLENLNITEKPSKSLSMDFVESRPNSGDAVNNDRSLDHGLGHTSIPASTSLEPGPAVENHAQVVRQQIDNLIRKGHNRGFQPLGKAETWADEMDREEELAPKSKSIIDEYSQSDRSASGGTSRPGSTSNSAYSQLRPSLPTTTVTSGRSMLHSTWWRRA